MKIIGKYIYIKHKGGTHSRWVSSNFTISNLIELIKNDFICGGTSDLKIQISLDDKVIDDHTIELTSFTTYSFEIIIPSNAIIVACQYMKYTVFRCNGKGVFLSVKDISTHFGQKGSCLYDVATNGWTTVPVGGRWYEFKTADYFGVIDRFMSYFSFE